jgi:hypothetical protein
MPGFLRKLFGGKPEAAPTSKAGPDYDKNPVAVAQLTDVPDSPVGRSAACGEETAEQEYERFRAEFCFRPGENLMQYLEAQGMVHLRDWLHWQTPEAEPKALIRLGLAMMDRGLNIWEQPGISIFLLGRWSEGAGCSDETYDCLQTFAKLLGKPIKFFFQESEDAEGYRICRFEP